MPRKIDPGKIKVGHGLAASDSVEVNAMIPSGAGAAPAGLTSHVQDDHDAHPAHAVSIDNVPDTYDAAHVEGALDELSALVPPRPPTIGKGYDFLKVNTLPDWGILKLDDASIAIRHPNLGFEWDTSSQLQGAEVYPYFWQAFQTTEGFTPANNDPKDVHFNVHDASYVGGGAGNAHAGAFMREVEGAPTLQTTHCVIPSSGPAGGQKAVVSGVVYPADRGTLALIRLAPGGQFDELVNAHSLLSRCVAAINLGQGILDMCDGDPGGIFTLGASGGAEAPQSFDPYSFPGRATGQYNLSELHTGQYGDWGPSAGAPLPAPFNDGDQDGVAGWDYAGQVRLGTDPNAGVATLVGGIPILGAGTVARGGGHDQNFLGYRVPYMDDYTPESGLRFTPMDEKGRFFRKPAVPGGSCATAGEYPPFDKEYWTWQIARYRHQFTMDSTVILAGDAREDGSYLLVHFKKEEYFEALVRDGVWPNASQIYSQNLVDDSDVEALENKADYSGGPSKAAKSYHVIRRMVYEDPRGALPAETTQATLVITKDSQGWELQSISGIKYHIPQKMSDTNYNGSLIADVSVEYHGSGTAGAGFAGFWENSWRTSPLIEENSSLVNEYPLFLSMGHFTSSEKWTDGQGFLQTGLNDPLYVGERIRRERLEISSFDLATHLADTPVATDGAKINGSILLTGDTDNLPKFSQDASVRAFQRRPLGHISSIGGVLPTPNEVQDAIWPRDKLEVSEQVSGLSGLKMLYHSGRSLKSGQNSVYGNFLSGGQPWPTALNPTRDAEERFLDETYRWYSALKSTAMVPVTTATEMEQLVGPGLPHGPTKIKFPVRPQVADVTASGVQWVTTGWVTGGFHLLNIAFSDQAQVAGLPDRDPSVVEGVTSALPSNGILMYPQKDYTNGYTPSNALLAHSPSLEQYDYSGASGPAVYMRCFSLANGEGKTSVRLVFKGIQLEDFKRASGTIGSTKMAILVKVPGLTTWMDLGRKDGDGPSKQDAFKDGAGCMVIGADTYDLEPSVEDGIVSCQVVANLGPAASLFEGLTRANVTEVPLMMKIILKDTADTKLMNFEQGGPEGPCKDLRGLIQINAFIQG